MADGSALGADGFKAGIGYAEVEKGQVAATGSDPKDEEVYAIYASYVAGPVTVGAQRNTTTSASKDKEADMYSIAFNVNENLAILMLNKILST